jgi:hypothetical protein
MWFRGNNRRDTPVRTPRIPMRQNVVRYEEPRPCIATRAWPCDVVTIGDSSGHSVGCTGTCNIFIRFHINFDSWKTDFACGFNSALERHNLSEKLTTVEPRITTLIRSVKHSFCKKFVMWIWEIHVIPFCSLCVQTGSGAHPASFTIVTGVFPRDADHSSPSSADVKNE